MWGPRPLSAAPASRNDTCVAPASVSRAPRRARHRSRTPISAAPASRNDTCVAPASVYRAPRRARHRSRAPKCRACQQKRHLCRACQRFPDSPKSQNPAQRCGEKLPTFSVGLLDFKLNSSPPPELFSSPGLLLEAPWTRDSLKSPTTQPQRLLECPTLYTPETPWSAQQRLPENSVPNPRVPGAQSFPAPDLSLERPTQRLAGVPKPSETPQRLPGDSHLCTEEPHEHSASVDEEEDEEDSSSCPKRREATSASSTSRPDPVRSGVKPPARIRRRRSRAVSWA